MDTRRDGIALGGVRFVVGGAICLMVLASPVRAQRVVGVVLDSTSGSPIIDARITYIGTRQLAARTDVSGRFEFDASGDEHVILRLRALGYGPGAVELRLPLAGPLVFHLSPRPFELEPIEVTAPQPLHGVLLRGFERRRQRGFGMFMTEEEIKRRPAYRVFDLIQQMPFVRIRPQGFSSYFVQLGSRKCAPFVYVDHAPIGIADNRIDDFVSASDVVAVEVYRRASVVPAEFSGNRASCGVIVLWTRRGT